MLYVLLEENWSVFTAHSYNFYMQTELNCQPKWQWRYKAWSQKKFYLEWKCWKKSLV